MISQDSRCDRSHHSHSITLSARIWDGMRAADLEHRGSVRWHYCWVDVASIVEAEVGAVDDASSVRTIDGASMRTVLVDVEVRPSWSVAT